ncbi:alpha/beta hydrolase [Metapseudomonas otitidis]|uniref:hypothetical protein n=1 Tax=Metapseudomonas otitidis TaxID=319939 RepID=UPI0013F62194
MSASRIGECRAKTGAIPAKPQAHCRSIDGGAGSGRRAWPDRDDLDPFADERVGAVMLMAPPGVLFGRKGLEPVPLNSGEEDRVLPLEQNARALLRKLPDFRLVPGAGHFVFMAPCSEEMNALVPQVCEYAEAVRFFTRTLGACKHRCADSPHGWDAASQMHRLIVVWLHG